jgi:FkbM family methyltransferase
MLRRHRLMSGWMRLTGEDPVQLVRIRGDARGFADLSDGFLRLIVIEGDFESDFFRIADALLQGGGVFLDVGANHGLLSFGLAQELSGSVQFHLFEPNPKLVRSIEKTRKLYPLMQVHVNDVAVCDQDGTVQFHCQEDQTGASHIVISGGIPVTSLKLDTYLETKRIDCVQLLKLDIEGYELLALRGAEQSLRRHLVKAIYFEYFEKNLIRIGPAAKLIEFLESVAYEVCFCRRCDLPKESLGYTLRKAPPGHGLPLLPVKTGRIPSITDLLAVPREDIVRV